MGCDGNISKAFRCIDDRSVYLLDELLHRKANARSMVHEAYWDGHVWQRNEGGVIACSAVL